MPWCPACERFLAPPTVTPGGRCPDCRGEVEAATRRVTAAPGSGSGSGSGSDEATPRARPDQGDLPPVPWHLKLLGGAAVVYLGWRLVQGIVWVVDKI